MAWLEGLSTLKGQITSFTREVLSEGRDEIHDASSELTASKKKIEELEALCASQDLEITELRERNAELERRLIAEGATPVTDTAVWENVELQNSPIQDRPVRTNEVQLQDVSSDSPDGRLAALQSTKQELAEKSQLLVVFKEQLDSLSAEKQHVSTRCVHLEEQVQKLSNQLENESAKRTKSESSELEQLRSQLQAATDQLAQTRDENMGVLREQLNAAESKIEELEKELLKVHQQMLDHLSDSQMNTSEIRGEVEQTRWQLLQDSGIQKTELLRARQDMVNRIIQMGEKSREVEMSMKKLQLDGKHLTADIVAIIHKLGDPEQQELIHGTLKALELENQVLKLRNAQLELAGNTETIKGSSYESSNKVDYHCGGDEKKFSGEHKTDVNSKHSDIGSRKTEDDSETESLKSEVSELCLLKQKLDNQVSQLQTKVETYERDIECFEVMKSDWTVEKKMLEQLLSDLKGQLREKEEKLNLVTAQKGLIEVKKHSLIQTDKCEEDLVLQERVDELMDQLTRVQEEKKQLQDGEDFLTSEVDAMAKIVQDLESQLARAQEENAGLNKSLEELDDQHQHAIDQLLQVKESLSKECERLRSESETLKERFEYEERRTQSENFEKIDVGTECFPVHLNKGIQAEPCSDFQGNDEVHVQCRRNLETEIEEKILKLVTFEIPRDYYSLNSNNRDEITLLGTVEALVKMCVECKWQRDTLERKVTEFMKELRDAKHMYEERSKAAYELDCECRTLQGNVETLIQELMVYKSGGGETLAPILEKSEETEAVEQKIMILENEIEVLREARSNLEVEARALREEGHKLDSKLQTANAMLRNQENLETEISRWQTAATSAGGQLKEALAAKCCLEEEVDMLRSQLQRVEAMIQHQVSSSQQMVEKLEEEVAQLNERLLDQESLRSENEGLLNMVSYTQDQLHLSNLDRSKLKEEIEELQKHIEAQGHFQTEVSSLQHQLLETQHTKEQLTTKIRELEETSLRISEYERHSQELHEGLENCKEDLEALKVKLNEKEDQLNDEMNSKLLIQKELGHIQEELKIKLEEISKFKDEKTLFDENLVRIVQKKSDAESKYDKLLSELHSRDVEIQNLTTMKLQLEQEVERLCSPIVQTEYQATATEVNTWKETAEAYERQLNEAFKVRDELEQECRRLYLIETRIQSQEHLDQEVEQLKKMLAEMEQNSDHLLTDKLLLEKQFADIKQQLHNVVEMEKEAKERAATAEQQLTDVLNDKAELETKIQMMHTVEEKFKNLQKEFIRKEELNFSLQQELSEVASAKCELEVECKRLLAVEGKLRNQESLELELHELRHKLAGVKKELDEAVVAKSQLEDDGKKIDTAHGPFKSEVVTQNSKSGALEECEMWNHPEMLKMKQEIKILQSKHQKLVSLLENKTHEYDILKANNIKLMQMYAEQMSSTNRCEGACQSECHESVQMAKEVIANLSKIIKDKDMEIEALNQNSGTLLHHNDTNSKSEEFMKFQELVSGQLSRLNDEKTELLRTVQVKHQENIQYNNEIQRLTGLLEQEMNKLAEMKFHYANLAQQYGEKQMLLLNTQNDLTAAMSRIQQLEKGHTKLASCSDAGEHDNTDAAHRMSVLVQRHAQEQQAMENTIQSLHSQVKDLQKQVLLLSEQQHHEPTHHTQNKTVNVDVLVPEGFQVQLETLQAEYKQMADSLLQEQTRNKYLQNEVQEQCEKECVLLKELERLRLHLVAVEEGYTQEALNAEGQVKELQNKLAQAEERIKNSSTAYTSASIRANQHVESLQGQARLIAQQRDEIQLKLSAAEDQIHHHSAALCNLQIVLEQFQNDKEREIKLATERLQQQLQGAQQRHDELCAEVTALKLQLSEAKEGLSAAARLGEQLDKKSEMIAGLKEEVSKLNSQLQESEARVQSASLSAEGKVDRYLVKNLVLGYFMAAPKTRGQVLRIVATVLDFNQEERDRVGLESGTPASGWFRNFLQPGKGPPNTQSLSEAFVRFLENESQPQPQLRLLPEGQEAVQGDGRSDSPSSSTGSSHRRSPLLLSEVHLPTFTQFPVGRNSSSILKDVLKDS